jgi:hypothetical protein
LPERTTSRGGKQVPYYPIIDWATMGPQNPGGGSVAEFVTLRGEDPLVFPVFTSMARFWAFADKYFAEDDPVWPSTFPMTPFRLAEMIEALGEAGAPSSLVFNPTAVSEGQWRSAKEPIPGAHFCRFITEIRPEVRRLNQEAIARFGVAPPGSPAYEEAMDWLWPEIGRMSESAGARVDEWWDRHGSRE